MAAFMRACVSRFIISRPQVTNLGAPRNVKYVQSIFPQQILSRPCSDMANPGPDQDQVHRIKVVTHEDPYLKRFVASDFIGKGGKNVKDLALECNISASDGNLWISGNDADVVKKTAEKVTAEVQRIQKGVFPIYRKVVTEVSENKEFQERVFGVLIGKGGDNLKKLCLEIGVNFHLYIHEGEIFVYGKDDEELNKAVDKVQQEIQRIKEILNPMFSDKVLTDKDKEIHDRIYGKIVGRNGDNLKRLRLELGFEFQIEESEGNILIYGMNDDQVKTATEKVQQEVNRIKEEDSLLFREKLLTDEDEVIHSSICGRIIGIKGENLQRLRSKIGLGFELTARNNHMIISGTDAEKVKQAVEILREEIQRLKNDSVMKVLTDENVLVHKKLCGILIGRQGRNINRLMTESGLNFQVDVPKNVVGHILVTGTDAEMRKKAVEKVQQEVQRIRKEFIPCFEKVFTDANKELRDKICGRLIGKGGENLKKLKSEANLDFDIYSASIHDEIDFVLVSGPDVEVVKEAKEKVQQEVERIKRDVLIRS